MRAHFPNNPRAPLVLVYDFAALLVLSGGRPKLATAQTLPDHTPDKTPLLASTKGGYVVSSVYSLSPLCVAEHRKSVWVKHDECLSVASFRRVQTD